MSKLEDQTCCGGHEEYDNNHRHWKTNVPAPFPITPPSAKLSKT